jgi:hypothetical protein
MFESKRKRIGTVATVVISGVLAVGAGVALAQSGPGSGGSHHRKPHAARSMAPGGPIGEDLTYAQFHVQREGKEEVVRMDRGTIVSVGEGSITLKENDGSEVTIAVDSSTKVLAGPRSGSTSLSDLQEGEEVTVCGPEGGTAKAVMLPPKNGRPPAGGQGQMPPPPGAM